MPNPKPGEDKQAYVSRFMASAEAQKDFPDEKQRAAVAYSKFGERRNAVPLCSECGCEAVEADGRLTCPSCGLIDRHPTPAVEAIPNMCLNPQCAHPMNGEHDAIGCHVPGCLCTETRSPISAPEDALSNVETKHSFEKENADPRAAFEAHAKECEGCMNAYNTGAPEAMCGAGAAIMNGGGKEADAAEVGRHLEGIEHEVAEMVSNSAGDDAIARFEAARQVYAKELAEHQKTLAMARQAVDTGLVAKAQALVDTVQSKIAALERQKVVMENANVDKFAKGGDEFGKPGGTVTLVNGAERQNSAPARACINGVVVEEFRGRR